jgi:hypothetical protein
MLDILWPASVTRERYDFVEITDDTALLNKCTTEVVSMERNK